jgi:hypothetical protein
MFSYVEFAEHSLFKMFLAQKQDLNILDSILANQLVIEKKVPDTLADLSRIFAEGSGLFEEEIITCYAVDLINLTLDTKALDSISGLQTEYSSLQVYFYTSSETGLNAESKKNWQKVGLEYTVLKATDPQLMAQIAHSYLSKIGFELNLKDLNTILKESKSYTELVDNIDFVSLAGDTAEAVKSLIKEEKVPIFVMGFDPAKLSSQLPRWYSQIGEDELQLALSLIFGKLDKNNSQSAREMTKKLILTDQKIKTRSKVSPLTWYRLFLWEAGKVSTN